MQWDSNKTNFDRNLAVVIGIDIGIDHYDSRGIHDLQTAVNDANAFANLLRDEYGYKDEYIIRLFSPKNDEVQVAGFTKLFSQVSQIALAPVFAIFLIIRVARRVATAGANPAPLTKTGANIPAALV